MSHTNRSNASISSVNSSNERNKSLTGKEYENADWHVEPTVVLLVFIGIFIVLINSSVVFLVWKKHFLRKAVNACLTSLACSDFLAGFLGIPLVLSCTYLSQQDLSQLCLAMELCMRFLSISTPLHLLIVALERYFVIVHSVEVTAISGKRKLGVLLAGIWGLALGVSLLQLTWVDLQAEEAEQKEIQQIEVVYDLACFTGFAALPLLIIVWAFSGIFLALRKQSKTIERNTPRNFSQKELKRVHKHERRAAYIYCTMIVVYILGWFSYFLQGLQNDLSIEWSLPIPGFVASILVLGRFGTALLNPLLYSFFKRDFKRAFHLTWTEFFKAETNSTQNSFEMRNLRACSRAV